MQALGRLHGHVPLCQRAEAEQERGERTVNGIIGMVAGIIIFAYIGVAVWVIWTRRTLAGSAAVSAGFLCGGLLVVPVAEAVATFLCWAVVILVILWLIGAILG